MCASRALLPDNVEVEGMFVTEGGCLRLWQATERFYWLAVGPKNELQLLETDRSPCYCMFPSGKVVFSPYERPAATACSNTQRAKMHGPTSCARCCENAPVLLLRNLVKRVRLDSCPVGRFHWPDLLLRGAGTTKAVLCGQPAWSRELHLGRPGERGDSFISMGSLPPYLPSQGG